MQITQTDTYENYYACSLTQHLKNIVNLLSLQKSPHHIPENLDVTKTTTMSRRGRYALK